MSRPSHFPWQIKSFSRNLLYLHITQTVAGNISRYNEIPMKISYEELSNGAIIEFDEEKENFHIQVKNAHYWTGDPAAF